MAWSDDLERAAKAGKGVPDGLTANERMLFIAMRGLYYQFGAGVITIDQAKREKRQVMNDFNAAELREKSREKSIKAWRWVDLSLNNCECPECRKLKEAILGLENVF